MKKLLVLFVFAVTLLSSVSAKAQKSSVSYVNVPILKVLDSRDAYVVIYQKNRVGAASVVVPKSWSVPTKGEPIKLRLRTVNIQNDSYMTVYKKDGEFYRVTLTLPAKKSNPVWGVLDKSKVPDGVDKETLEELEL